MTKKPDPANLDRAKASASRELAKDPSALADSMNLPQTGAVRKAILAVAAQAPQSCRRTYLMAMKGRSMRAAVKANCYYCMGWNKGDVPGCTSPTCPLYPYRPGA